jgi:sugar lactone lactonase YvrE
MNVELLADAKTTLGEGPIWDARTQTLYWIGIFDKRIYAGSDLLAELDDFIGCIVPRKSGGLVLALSHAEGGHLRSRFASLDVESGDGKCDPCGRFIAGTMDMGEKDPLGSLYSFDGKSVTKLLSNVTISNGLTWSPDHKTFYYIDTPTREVKAFDYDLKAGTIANARSAVRIPEAFGWPDGMTSDKQGNLWIAMWGGAQVTKWNPNTGQLLEQIPVPAKNVSSCVFGGKNLNELYITSARKDLDEAALMKYPLTGGLFRLQTNVEGMPTFEFEG